MFRSLRLRIALSHALVLIVILLALGISMQFVLTRSLDNAATGELTAIAEGQVERIQEAGHAVPSADSDIPSAAGVQVGVFLPGGTALGEPIEIPGWLRHYPDRLTDLTVEGEHVRVVVMPAEVNGTVAAWVAAGRSLAAEDRLLHRMRLLLLAGGSLAVLASLVAGWWLAGRAVRPVERAYEAQAGFAADASHELRTPLTFVRSGVEVLAEKEPGLGGQVLAEVDYLTGLTQRLLLLARAERGSIRLEVEPVDVGAACRSAARRSERAHGNALSTGGTDLAALADRMALEAALDAVLENVERHGGGSAEVRWSREDGRVEIGIADHGPGLPEDLHGRAFERFFRVDPSRARETGGAGLGLALAKTLVEAQEGRMWLEPTPGGGLTVRIGLPAA
jgi:signal transduction histidine kinase